jgi:hypothetical protein
MEPGVFFFSLGKAHPFQIQRLIGAYAPHRGTAYLASSSTGAVSACLRMADSRRHFAEGFERGFVGWG